jgi:enoyl-CoA hydratase
MAQLEVHVEDRVATATVNRPEAMNAMSGELLASIIEEFGKLGARQDVGCIILTGAGEKSFIAGADIKEMKDKDAAGGRAWAELGQRVTLAIEGAPQPVIAAVNGYALGGGCEIAMACDLRLASANARFGQPEINLGVIPGWSATQRLVRLCGSGIARELVYTGRMMDADEALRYGLVNAVYPKDELLSKAREMAETMASKSWIVQRYAKEAMRRALDQDLAGGLALEANLFGLCFATEDQKEGMSAFVDKRQAEFKHR